MIKKLCFPGETRRLAAVRREARRFLLSNGFGEGAAELMVLALDEACTNIIRHAYGPIRHAEGLDRRPVRLEMRVLRDRVRFRLRDYGKPCDPKKIKSRALEDIRPGGLGVHIIRHAFDHVDYSPQPRGTILTLEKSLPDCALLQPRPR